MKEYNFSTPNVKIRIKDVRYIYSGGTVHCFLTMEDMWHSSDEYVKLAYCCSDLGMRFAINTTYRLVVPEKINCDGIRSSCDKFIYMPSDYEYHGIATLKTGDSSDIEIAKRIAYQKAYRQLTSFYYNCYRNLYEFMISYCRDVWYPQICDIANRWADSNGRIMNTVE